MCVGTDSLNRLILLWYTGHNCKCKRPQESRGRRIWEVQRWHPENPIQRASCTYPWHYSQKCCCAGHWYQNHQELLTEKEKQNKKKVNATWCLKCYSASENDAMPIKDSKSSLQTAEMLQDETHEHFRLTLLAETSYGPTCRSQTIGIKISLCASFGQECLR